MASKKVDVAEMWRALDKKADVAHVEEALHTKADCGALAKVQERSVANSDIAGRIILLKEELASKAAFKVRPVFRF